MSNDTVGTSIMNYDNAIKVKLEDASECYMIFSKYYFDSEAISKEHVLKRWLKLGDKVRSYIIVNNDSYYIAIHYGKETPEFLLFVADDLTAKKIISK